MRKGTKRLLGAGIVAGVAYAGWRAWKTRVPEPSPVSWDTRRRSRSHRFLARRPPQRRRRTERRRRIRRSGRRRRVPAHASGEGEAHERHLPRSGRRQLRPHQARPLLRDRGSRGGRRPAPREALTALAFESHHGFELFVGIVTDTTNDIGARPKQGRCTRRSIAALALAATLGTPRARSASTRSGSSSSRPMGVQSEVRSDSREWHGYARSDQEPPSRPPRRSSTPSE